MKLTTAAAASLAALLFLAGCGSDADESASTPTPSAPPSQTQSPASTPGTIVDVAAGNPSFSTLVSAVQAADLVETLSGEGPFTVFAPTNDAFAALPEGVLDKLLEPENADALTAILTYHVVPGEVTSGELQPGEVTTVEGSTLMVKTDGGVSVNDATVVQADVEASNGVIHVIDTVLIPESVDPADL